GGDAGRPVAVGPVDPAGPGGGLARLCGSSRRRREMTRALLLSACAAALALSACGVDPQPPQYGADPTLPTPHRGLLPSMVISLPAAWGDARPVVPQGYTITAIATDLEIPRQTLVLPNGDILVA